MPNILENKKKFIFLALIAMLLWGSAIPLIKTTYKILNIGHNDTGAKIFIAGARFFLAGLLTFIYYFIFRKQKLNIKKVNIKLILILSLVQTTIQYLFYYIGLSHTAGIKTSIIQSTNSFMIVILSFFLIPNEKIKKKHIISIFIGTLSIVIINLKSNFDFSISFFGDFFIIIATFFNALATILLRKYKDQDIFILTGSQFFLGSLPLLTIGFFLNEKTLILDFTIFLLLLYGAFISATAFSIWAYVLKYQSATEFSIYKLFIPIFGSLLSIIFLGENLTINLIIGLGLVLYGSYIINKY